MRFKGLDLNLLVTLDVLIEERSVSRAAERLHLSQPSVSAALAKLRDYFNDPLLEIQGKRMVPTAHATAAAAGAGRGAGQRRPDDHPGAAIRSGDLGSLVPRLPVGLPVDRAVPAPGAAAAEAGAPHPAGAAAAVATARSTSWNRGRSTSRCCRRKTACPTTQPSCCSRNDFVVAGWSGNPLMAQPIDEAVFSRRPTWRCASEQGPGGRSPRTSCSSAAGSGRWKWSPPPSCRCRNCWWAPRG